MAEPAEVRIDASADAQQEACWHALFDLYEKSPQGWTLIGGRMARACMRRCARPELGARTWVRNRRQLQNATLRYRVGHVITTIDSLRRTRA